MYFHRCFSGNYIYSAKIFLKYFQFLIRIFLLKRTTCNLTMKPKVLELVIFHVARYQWFSKLNYEMDHIYFRYKIYWKCHMYGEIKETTLWKSVNLCRFLEMTLVNCFATSCVVLLEQIKDWICSRTNW